MLFVVRVTSASGFAVLYVLIALDLAELRPPGMEIFAVGVAVFYGLRSALRLGLRSAVMESCVSGFTVLYVLVAPDLAELRPPGMEIFALGVAVFCMLVVLPLPVMETFVSGCACPGSMCCSWHGPSYSLPTRGCWHPPRSR